MTRAACRRRGTGACEALALALGALVFTTFAAHAMDLRSLWNFADPAASEARFRERLAGAAGDDALTLQTQIARTYSLRSRFDEAHALLDAIEPQLAQAGPEPRVRWLLERGRTLRSSKRVAEAMPLFRRALERAQAAGLDALTVDAMHMVALAEPATDAQLEWTRRARALAQRSPDPEAQRWDASLANNIGWSLHEAGRHDEALASFRTALAARERQRGDPADLRAAHWMVAFELRALKRHDEALAILRRLDAEGEAAGAPDGFVHEEIGENLLALGRPDEARPAFARAYALLSADTSLDRPDDARLARLLALSKPAR